MRAVIQRVNEASVWVDGKRISSIKRGIVILLGIEKKDTPKELVKMVDRCLNLRIFEDEEGKMNYSVLEKHYDVLVVPNFTVASHIKKGRRPSFDNAMPPEKAMHMFTQFVKTIWEMGVDVSSGQFGAHMHVALVNDGPVTFIIEV